MAVRAERVTSVDTGSRYGDGQPIRLSTLMFLVIIAALLLANLVQMMKAQRERMLAQQALRDSMVAQQKAQVIIDQYLSQIGEQSAVFKPGPKTEAPAAGSR
jgi:hypothetical protein